MRRYTNSVADRNDGRAIQNAQVRVWHTDGTAAVVYSNSTGTAIQAQPILTNIYGQYSFYAPDGLYDISHAYGADTNWVYRVQIYDINPDAFDPRSERFGAAGDGITDDTLAIQAAIDAAEVSGGSVFFASGTGPYVVSAALEIRGNVTVDLNGCTIDGSTCAGAVFLCEGTRTTAGFAAGVAAGVTQFTQAASGVVAGDIVMFSSSDIWPGRQYDYVVTSGQIFRVMEKVGNDHYLSEAVVYDLTTACQLHKLTAIHPVIKNGTIIGGGTNIIYSLLCDTARFENLTLGGQSADYASAIKIMLSYGTIIDNVRISAGDAAANGVYGVVIAGPNTGTMVSRVSGVNLRHVFTTTYHDAIDGTHDNTCGVYWTKVFDSRGSQGVNSAFDTHPTGRFFTFENCTAEQFGGGTAEAHSQAGFSSRCSDTHWVGCVARGAGGNYTGFRFGHYDTATGCNPLENVTLKSCVAEGHGWGLVDIQNASSGVISGHSEDSDRFAILGNCDPAAWNAAYYYIPGDWVTSGGSIYECLTANLNDVPPSANWNAVAGASRDRGQLTFNACTWTASAAPTYSIFQTFGIVGANYGYINLNGCTFPDVSVASDGNVRIKAHKVTVRGCTIGDIETVTQVASLYVSLSNTGYFDVSDNYLAGATYPIIIPSTGRAGGHVEFRAGAAPVANFDAEVGDLIWHTAPTAGDDDTVSGGSGMGWVCTTAGEVGVGVFTLWGVVNS